MDTWQEAKKLANDATEDTDFYESVQDKYMDSMEAKLSSLRASLQDFWSNLLDTGAINDGITAINLLVQALNGLVGVLKSLGDFTGLGSLPTIFGTLGASVFGVNLQKNIKNTRESLFEDYKNELEKIQKQTKENGLPDYSDMVLSKPKMFDGWKQGFKQTWKEFKKLGMTTEASKQFTSPIDAFVKAKNKLGDSASVFDKLKAGSSGLLNSLTGVTKGVIGLTAVIIGLKAGKWVLDQLGDSSEEVAKKAKNAGDAYIAGQKKLQENKTSLNEISAEWSQLSEGVNMSNNSNISLTNDQYERFLTLNNQIADILPNTVTGYDAQGNAITSLTGKLNDLNNAYDQSALKQAKEDLKNFDAVQEDLSNKTGNRDWVTKVKDTFGNLGSVLKNGGQAVIGSTGTDYETAIKELQKVQKMSFEEADKYIIKNGMKNDTELAALNGAIPGGGIMLDWWKETFFGKKNNKYTNQWLRSGQGTGALEAYVKGDWNSDFWEETKKEIPLKISELQDVIDDSTSNYQMMMQDVLKTLTLDKDKYPDFANMDNNTISSISALINNLPTDKLAEFGQNTSKAKAYLSSFLSTVNENPDVKKSLNNLLSINDNTPIEDMRNILDKDLSNVTKALDLDKDGVKEFKFRLGLDKREDVIKQLDDVYDIAEKKGDKLSNKAKDTTNDIASAKAEKEYERLVKKRQKIAENPNSKDDVYWGNVNEYDRTIIPMTEKVLQELKSKKLALQEDTLDSFGEYITTFGLSKEIGNGKLKGQQIMFTPILPDGTILSQNALDQYINQITQNASSKQDVLDADAKGVKIGDQLIKGVVNDVTEIGDDQINSVLSQIFEKIDAEKITGNSDALRDAINSVLHSALKVTDSGAKDEISSYISEELASIMNDATNSEEVKNALSSTAKEWISVSDSINKSYTQHNEQSKIYDKEFKSLKKINKQNKTERDYKKKIGKFIKDNNIQTASQVGLLKQCVEEADTLNEAFQKYKSTSVDLIINDESLASLEKNLETVQNAIKNFNDAWSESMTPHGMSSEAMSDIKNMFSDLPSYNYDKLFESTSSGVHMNVEELRKLRAEYDKIEKSKYTDKLDEEVAAYQEVCKQIAEATTLSEKQELISKKDALEEKIQQTNELISRYEGLTNAVQQYYEALERGEEGDTYDKITEGYESAKKLWEEGKVGTNEFQAYTQMWTNEDLSGQDSDAYVAAWQKAQSKIERWATEDGSGVENLLTDINAVNKAWAHMDENGNWQLDLPDMKELADTLQISEPLVDAMMRKLTDYGFKIDFSEEADNLRKLRNEAKEANEEFGSFENFDKVDDTALQKVTKDVNEIQKMKDFKFDLDIEDEDALRDQIDTADNLRKALVDVYGEGSEQVKNFDKQLDYSKAKLGEMESVAQLAKEGFNLNMDLDNNKKDLEDIVESLLKISGFKDIKLNLDGSSLSSVKKDLSTIEEAVGKLNKNDKGQVDLTQDGATELLETYSALLNQQSKLKLQKDAIGKRDTSKIKNQSEQSAVSDLQGYQQSIENLKNAQKINDTFGAGTVDTKDLEKGVNKFIKNLKSSNKDVQNALKKYKIDVSKLGDNDKANRDYIDSQIKAYNEAEEKKSSKKETSKKDSGSKKESGKKDYSEYNNFASKSSADVSDFASGVKDKVGEIWKSIKSGFGDAWDSVVKSFSEWGASIGEALSKAYDTVSEKMSSIGKAINEGFSKAWDSAKNAVTDWYKSVKDNVGNAVNDVKEKMSEMWDSFKGSDTGQALSHLFDSLGNFGGELWNLLGKSFDELKENISTKLKEAWDNATKTITDWGTDAGAALQTAWDTVVNTVSDWASPIVEKISNAFNTAKDTINDWGNSAGQYLSDAWNNAVETATGWKEAIHKKVNEAMNGAKEGFQDAWDSITETVSGWKDSIDEAISPMIDSAKKWGKDIIKGIDEGLGDGIENIANFFDQAADVIKNAGNIGDVVDVIFSKIKSDIQSKIRELASSLPQWLKDIITKLTGIKLDLPEINFDGLDLSDEEKEVVVKYVADHSDIDNYSPEEKDAIAKYLADPSQLDSFTPEEKEAIARFIAEHSDVDSWTPDQKEALARYLKETSDPDSYKPKDKTATAIYNKDSSDVDSYNPPNLTRTVTFWASVKKTASDLWGFITGKGHVDDTAHIEGTAHINGIAHAHGTAYANGTKGDWGAKEDETSLVGELGPELRVKKDGKWDLLGEKGAQFAQIHKGEIIFNHIQTKELFENGYVTSGHGRGKAFVNGTVGKLNSLFKVGSGAAYANGSYSGSGHFVKNKNFYSNAKVDQGSTKAASKAASKAAQEAKEDFKETLDWIEVMLDRLEREIDKLDTIASSAYKKFSTRNKTLGDEFSKVTQEIELQQKAYEAYMNKANSMGLSADYMDKIKNGRLEIEDITDEKTNDLISEVQEWIDKAYDARDAVNELEEKLGEIVKTNFDNINDEFSSQLEMIEHENKLLETQLDLIEAKGMFSGQAYYDSLIKNEEKYVEKLHDQYMDLYNAMYDALDTKQIEEGSEAYYDMINEINSVSEAWSEAKKQLVDYKNEAYEMDWSIFEKGMEYFSDITDESNFLQDILRVGDNDVFVKKTGRLNDNGNAINSLHAMNYNAYMAQADKYKEKIAELNEEIAKDPTNTKLIDKRNEYIQQQREMIQNANEEKKSIHDLVEESYNKMLDVLQKLIDKRKDLLQSQKDLYDYEKNISEQAKNITDLKKQLASISNDDSEEAGAKKQQLSSDLKDAQADLEASEYDQWLSDQEKLLDTLYDQYESILNERLDNIDGLLQDSIDYANQNSDKVNTTITEASDKVGYTITEGMQSIWNSTDSGVGKILSEYSTNFLSSMNTVTEYLLYIFRKMGGKTKEDIEADRLRAEAEKKRQEELKRKQEEDKKKQQEAQQQKQNSIGNDTIAGIAAAIWCEGNSGWGNDPFRSGRLTEKIGAENARKVQDYINAHGYNGDLYRYWINNLGGNASRFHYSAFKTGGYTGNNEGFAMLHAKERVLNATQTKAFEQLVYSFLPQISEELGKLDNIKINASAINGRGMNSKVENSIDLTLNLPNVTNGDDFIKTLQTDKAVQKIIRSFTIDEAMGKNSLRKFNIK